MKPGTGVERPVRADGVRVGVMNVTGAVVHAVGSREIRGARVSSRRNAISSSRKSHESQVAPTPAPADVMQVPFSGLSGEPSAPTGVRRRMSLRASHRWPSSDSGVDLRPDRPSG